MLQSWRGFSHKDFANTAFPAVSETELRFNENSATIVGTSSEWNPSCAGRENLSNLGKESMTKSLGLVGALYIPFLFGQTTDPISGGAGWVGAGLLGLVLGWLLLVHLPSKDKQQRDLIDTFHQRSDRIATLNATESAAQREAFQGAMDKVVTHCSDEMATIREVFLREIESRIKAAFEKRA